MTTLQSSEVDNDIAQVRERWQEDDIQKQHGGHVYVCMFRILFDGKLL